MDAGVVVGLALAAAGIGVAVAGSWRARHVAPGIGQFMDSVAYRPEGDDYQERLTEPFTTRVLGGMGRTLFGRLERFMPGPYLDGVNRKIMLAGLAESRRPIDHLASQVVLAVPLGVLGFLYVGQSQPSPMMSVIAVGLLPAIGFMLPSARLSRKVKDRALALQRDLPDTLDLLAISVEAGLGFEGALAVVCEHFQSPLADEFSLALREMELGLTRREAFHNIKRRTDVPALSAFVLAMLQADSLGIPIGRVLKTQASELRSQRRQWAREKAAKLPVKILVPLVLFIFPPILIIVLGPAGLSLGELG